MTSLFKTLGILRRVPISIGISKLPGSIFFWFQHFPQTVLGLSTVSGPSPVEVSPPGPFEGAVDGAIKMPSSEVKVAGIRIIKGGEFSGGRMAGNANFKKPMDFG